MAGPKFLYEKLLYAGGLQRTASTQILSYRSFIASFGVGLIKPKGIKKTIPFGFFILLLL